LINDRYGSAVAVLFLLILNQSMRLLTAGTDLQLLNQDMLFFTDCNSYFLVSTLVFAKETSLLLAQAKCMLRRALNSFFLRFN
jgi:hypothetical protein